MKCTYETKLQRYAIGKWDVLTTGEYPARVGHIVGGNGKYLAETGPVTLGYYPTLKAAQAAIATVEIENVEQRMTGVIGKIE